MKPIYLELGDNFWVMAVPDADAHMDGHPVLTYSYAIYRHQPGTPNVHLVNTDQLLSPQSHKNPSYLGTINFEQPEKAWSYYSDGMNELKEDQVEELILKLSRYRKNPQVWEI